MKFKNIFLTAAATLASTCFRIKKWKRMTKSCQHKALIIRLISGLKYRKKDHAHSVG